MLKGKIILVAGILVFSFSLFANESGKIASLPYADTETFELVKAVGVGMATGAISGYFSAANPENGIHFGNFFLERSSRAGLNDMLSLKNGYQFYSCAASWAVWSSVTFFKSDFRHMLGVGIPTMIGRLVMQGLASKSL